MLQLTYSNISEDYVNLTKWSDVLMVTEKSSSSHACRWPGESVWRLGIYGTWQYEGLLPFNVTAFSIWHYPVCFICLPL